MKQPGATQTTLARMLTFAVSVFCLVLAGGNASFTQAQSSANRGSQDRQETTEAAKTDDDQSKVGAESSPGIDNAPTTIEEARIRAKLLHEAFSGALQVMHRDFFREDEKLILPSKSLEDVFAEMSRSQKVELRWLAVNANAMSQSHTPQNEFEKSVVKALSSGKDEYELASSDSYRFAGSIRLSASCVKCHVRNRTSNAERKAALVITMPLKMSD